ncbi:MAG: helix-turn-helix transcriptional regulator [Planctomycetia bacterium]|nr:helix-turn-helix transcriptional regulator [Planctomycetia bacterium]
MPFDAIVWDLDDDPDGNVQHSAQHGVSKEEVEDLPRDGRRCTSEATTMKRITRDRRLTPEVAAKYQTVREQVAAELPALVARHHERLASLDQLQGLLQQLKAARDAKGLSLADLTELTGMDRSALSKLETGQRANPTVETLVRYAEAVGKRLVVTLSDA